MKNNDNFGVRLNRLLILQQTINVQMHADAIRKLSNGLCVCTGNNPFAKARGLSSLTDAQFQTIQ